MDILHI